MLLQGLRFHWPDDVQPDGGGDQAAKMIEDEQSQRGLSRNFEPAKGRAEDWGKMGEGGRLEFSSELCNLSFEDPPDR